MDWLFRETTKCHLPSSLVQSELDCVGQAERTVGVSPLPKNVTAAILREALSCPTVPPALESTMESDQKMVVVVCRLGVTAVTSRR